MQFGNPSRERLANVSLIMTCVEIAQICMKACNPAKSAMFEVSLTPQFFDEYTLENAHSFECGVLIKASWGGKWLAQRSFLRVILFKTLMLHKSHNHSILIAAQHLLASLRTVKIQSLTMEIDVEQSSFTVAVIGDNSE